MPRSRLRPWPVNFAPGEDFAPGEGFACYTHAFLSHSAKFHDHSPAGAGTPPAAPACSLNFLVLRLAFAHVALSLGSEVTGTASGGGVRRKDSPQWL